MSAPSPTSSRPHLLSFLSGCRRRPSPAPLGLPTFNQCHQGVVKPPFTSPPSILPVTPSRAHPLDGNQGRRRPPMAINGHCLGRRTLLSLSPIRVVPKPPLLLLHLLEHPSSLALSPSTNRRRRRGEALCRRRLLSLSVLLSPFPFSRCTRRTTGTPSRRPGARSRGGNLPPRQAPVTRPPLFVARHLHRPTAVNEPLVSSVEHLRPLPCAPPPLPPSPYKGTSGPPLHPVPLPSSPPSPQRRRRGTPPLGHRLRCFPLPSDPWISFPISSSSSPCLCL
jgi:hypothetical protein